MVENYVEIVEQLSSGLDTIEYQKSLVCNAIDPKAKSIVERFDVNSVGKELAAWFSDLVRLEAPPTTLVALYFGLFETQEGCTLYVSGSNSYDPEDSDWACSNDWWPEGRYAPLPQLNELWVELVESSIEPWMVIQSLMIIVLRSFIQEHAPVLVRHLGNIHSTCGFDDGDLFALSTPLTPCA